MTAQIPDSLNYGCTTYSITGIRGAGMFNPIDLGIRPTPRITSCWRGFVCRYTVFDDRLLLESVLLNVSDPAPPIFGIAPSPPKGGAPFEAQYSQVNHPVGFSGQILAGHDFIHELYVHMGFHPAWKFRQVLYIEFVDGLLTGQRDRSAEAAKFRDKVRKQPELGMSSIEDSLILALDPWAG
jgi:hypothetical protein